ncbi:MAG: OmpA family protein [Gemmatimonadales bacterium]|nr:MAG: OmpA family protein [Gemmatimonadales bacterium]
MALSSFRTLEAFMSMTRRARGALVPLSFAIAALVLATPSPAHGQFIKKLKDTVKQAAEDETLSGVDQIVRGKVQCVFNDLECIQAAQDSGEDYVLTDDEGELLLDDDGQPVSDPNEAATMMGEPPPLMDAAPRPGEGAWANYDFVPGERVLFYDDFSDDNVGDFPRRLEFRKGNWDIIEWEGRTLLRNTGPRYSSIEIVLPEDLPERFTIETEAYLPHSNYQFIIATTPPLPGKTWSTLEGNFFQVGVAHGTGVKAPQGGGVESLNAAPILSEQLMPIRIMVDGRYAKVYVGEQRVANVPNAELARSSRLFIENTYSASADQPILIGPIRVAAGGADLYDALEEKGRVATHGILFAVNSANIRPESTPTLEEIGEMLVDHPDLRLSIEGHTDSDGEDTYNQTLSDGRAAAVRDYLIEQYGVDPSRLESAGFGESAPVESNDTPEGKQQNRRVELVKLD